MCSRLVWNPRTLNFHELRRGLGPRSTEFSYANAWFRNPKHSNFMCSRLVWDPKTLNFHVLKPGLEWNTGSHRHPEYTQGTPRWVYPGCSLGDIGKRRHSVWYPKTLNFHMLTLGLGAQNTEFSCAHAWSGTPKKYIFICSRLAWDSRTLNFHVLRPGLERQNGYGCLRRQA